MATCYAGPPQIWQPHGHSERGSEDEIVKCGLPIVVSFVALLLSACGDDSEHRSQPTATPTAAPRTATSTSSPSMPPGLTATATRPAAFTSTVSATATPTVSPSATPTASPTVSSTASPTVTPTASPSPTATASPTATSHTAPEQSSLSFDEQAAVSANGDYPPADPKTVCGADDRRFLAELTQGNPLEYKVPFRLADIKTAPSNVMVNGVATNVSLGGGDFPFDHTFGSDFNMDVVLDSPFTDAAQRNGMVLGDLHVELAEGQFPHDERAPGPPTGQDWEEMSTQARQGLVTRFVPDEGARVLVMGHWVVDCGHLDFQTELHPITFLANARMSGAKTVVDAFYNPYRETQRYNVDAAKALAFDDSARFDPPAAGPFPGMLITSVLRLQNAGPPPYQSIDHLESWAMLEPNRTSPVSWRVCAPAGSSGTRLVVQYHWVTRPGVEVVVTPDEASSCAVVQTTLGSETVAAPTPRVCVTPWDFLNEVAGEEAGIPDLDLQAQLGAFLPAQFKSRLDPAPIVNCYDPLQGPALESPPSGQQIDVRDDLLLPLYGTISVELAGPE
jgi:hypothetical protein